MISIDFTPRGVCSRNIHVDLADDGQTIEGVSFVGGCNGNLKAISKLVSGCPVSEVTDILRGNTCGSKPTSCADQLCCALDAAQEQARA
ncbi:TIGR03905 family TSCPD domain-containing protein [Collinsella sp. An268]|uniref:TIGR03905 family TSCPD domain-containing protein n=1 Tax=Collinsella sp. An268 TaxID=1965612 RepID=UPI000B39AFB0|nr:TIGR03905 family TSCPD domain-containing protein [Collinsella sp. An268]OUO64760.1 TIGR03905 family protein [Collinsella sp. An268]